jgi:hypothetical protein
MNDMQFIGLEETCVCRPVALTAEHRTPNPGVGGSNPSWPANFLLMSFSIISTGKMAILNNLTI